MEMRCFFVIKSSLGDDLHLSEPDAGFHRPAAALGTFQLQSLFLGRLGGPNLLGKLLSSVSFLVLGMSPCPFGVGPFFALLVDGDRLLRILTAFGTELPHFLRDLHGKSTIDRSVFASYLTIRGGIDRFGRKELGSYPRMSGPPGALLTRQIYFGPRFNHPEGKLSILSYAASPCRVEYHAPNNVPWDGKTQRPGFA